MTTDQTSSTAEGVAPKKGKTYFRWVVMVLIFLVYTLAASDRANIGIVLPFVKKEMNLTNTEAGLIVSLFFVGYSIAQIPSGFLVKRIGVRIIFPICMVLTSFFTGLLGTSSSVLAFKLNRMALGFAEAPLPVAMLSTINRWFPPNEKGTAAGFFLAAAKFGPVLMPPIGAVIIASFSWHYIFFFCALPGVFLALLWFIFVSNDPSRSPYTSAAERAHISEIAVGNAEQASVDATSDQTNGIDKFKTLDNYLRARPVDPLSSNKAVFKSLNIWGIAIGYLMMTGIINVILAWLPMYLTNEKHLSLLSVGFIASAPFIGGVIGNPLGGLFSDRVMGKRRKPNILIASLSSVVMMYALVFAPNQPFALAFLLFMTGLLLNIGYASFTIYPAGLTTKEVYPLAVSVVNTGGQAGGALFPLLTGIILDSYGWDAVFGFLSAASMLAFIIMIFVVEPKKRIER
ncbi:MAG: MFS transporter [Rhodospirillaceae bacterium]|nr:MFS transporter [Rhodospirillaceae bacterium]